MDYQILRYSSAYVGDSSNVPLSFRSTTIDELPEQIGSATGLNIYGYNFLNPNTIDAYVRIYSKSSSPTVGTDAITDTIQVPAGQSVVLKGADILYRIDSKSWIAATTGYLDTDTTSPVLDLICQVMYKQ